MPRDHDERARPGQGEQHDGKRGSVNHPGHVHYWAQIARSRSVTRQGVTLQRLSCRHRSVS